VIYLSLGSVCSWVAWEVDVLYNGLKEMGYKVVWSMKNPEFLPVQDDPDFYISPWVPQVELLAHPAIKAGLTHCGLGGVLEFSSAAVPIAAFPHFMDQSYNTSAMVGRKCGLSLIPPRKAFRNIKMENQFDEPMFTKDKVKEVFKELVENPVYKKNMLEMKRKSKY